MSNLKNLNILVVDDDELNVSILEYRLKKNVNILDNVCDSNLVMEKLEEEKYDIILMDLNMPKITGFELTKMIKDKYPDITVIAQTGFCDRYSMDKAMECGCSYFLKKPYSTEILLNTLTIFNKQ